MLFQVETSVWEYRDGPDETDARGLHTKTVGLHFQIQNKHFANNGGGVTPRMEILCSSSVGGSTRYRVVSTTLTRALASDKLAQEGFRKSAGNILLSKTTAEILMRNLLEFDWMLG